MTKITRNSIVTLHHQLGFTDDTVLEDTFGEDPQTFRLGMGEMAEGLELSLVDLEPGDEQTLDISPELAFGFPDSDAIHSLDRADFNPDKELQIGLIIEFSTPNGETLPGTILEFDEAKVKVDFNHPFAGQTVRYRVKIIDVEAPVLEPDSIN